MKYRHLGQSGLVVSRICLGTMAFGMKDWGCDQATADRLVGMFVEAGGNFVDTADMYSSGVSEEMLAAAIRGYHRDDLVLATKCWFRMGPSPNAKGLSRKHIVESLEASLRRLRTDYVDLYQVHGPDPFTPMEETMRALDDLVTSGKVRYLGCSNYFAWQIVKANAIADRNGSTRFVSAQHLYNLVRRDIEREILPACHDQGLGMLCWSPLAGGFLSGKFHRDEEPPEGSRISYRKEIDIPRYYNDAAFALVDVLREVAREVNQAPAEVALAWLLADPRISAVIVGPRREQHLQQSLRIADWDLADTYRNRLHDAMPLAHGYPQDWIELSWPNIAEE